MLLGSQPLIITPLAPSCPLPSQHTHTHARPPPLLLPLQIKTALARGAVYPGGAVDREAYGAGLVDVSRTLGYPQPAWAAP